MELELTQQDDGWFATDASAKIPVLVNLGDDLDVLIDADHGGQISAIRVGQDADFSQLERFAGVQPQHLLDPGIPTISIDILEEDWSKVHTLAQMRTVLTPSIRLAQRLTWAAQGAIACDQLIDDGYGAPIPEEWYPGDDDWSLQAMRFEFLRAFAKEVAVAVPSPPLPAEVAAAVRMAFTTLEPDETGWSQIARLWQDIPDDGDTDEIWAQLYASIENSRSGLVDLPEVVWAGASRMRSLGEGDGDDASPPPRLSQVWAYLDPGVRPINDSFSESVSVRDRGLEFELVVPFPQYDANSPAPDRTIYARVVSDPDREKRIVAVSALLPSDDAWIGNIARPVVYKRTTHTVEIVSDPTGPVLDNAFELQQQWLALSVAYELADEPGSEFRAEAARLESQLHGEDETS